MTYPRFVTSALNRKSSAVALAALFAITGSAFGAATLSTPMAGYKAGERIALIGTGFVPSENVSIQIVAASGAAASYQPIVAVADSAGKFESSWSIDPMDRSGNKFTVTAKGATSTATTQLQRVAFIETDKFDYNPQATANIRGEGFWPLEIVTLQVLHVSGKQGGPANLPFTTIADSAGRISSTWYVTPGSARAILFLTAQGKDSGLKALTVFTDPPQTILDDGGADDYPGQKDLNQLFFDYANSPTSIAVAWNWDDTAWSGANTGDACALFDTDNDGSANYALCVTVSGTPVNTGNTTTTLYSCGDARADRCSQPATPIQGFASTCAAGLPSNSDPFSLLHGAGNVCSDLGGTYPCKTTDTVAACTVILNDVGGATATRLTNVCSYPSGQPNSDPSDCVVNPNNGFLTIVKVNTETDQTKTFTFTTSPASYSSGSTFNITGAGSVGPISFGPTTNLSVTETVPSGWELYEASCAIGSGATPTGSKNGDAVTGVTIQTGLETICTFKNRIIRRSVTLTKTLVPSTDTGKFNLYAAGASATDQGNNGFATDTSVIFGSTVTVKETAGTGTDLANYTSVLSCPGVTLTPVSSTEATFTMPATNVSCTVTNTRITNNVTLTKALVPTDDPGKFNLTINGSTATDQGNGGSVQLSVAAGASVNMSEAAGTGTSLANYTSVLTCNGVTISPSTTSASFTMPTNAVSCTVTNTRITNTVTLTKALVPSDDPGKFNLTINGSTATDQGNGGSKQLTVAAGTPVNLSEAAGTGTSLANYTSVLTCSGVTIGASTTSASFTMPANAVNCTVTNTRITNTVTLTKALIPSNDTGKFNLTINGTTATDRGNGGFVQLTVPAGTPVTVSEAQGTGTVLAYYTSVLTCSGVTIGASTTSASFTMPTGAVNCTVTNTRKTLTLVLKKLVPIIPIGVGSAFNLLVNAVAVATNVSHNGQGSTSVYVGSQVAISETAGTGTSLANYTSTRGCDNTVLATGSGTSANITIPNIAGPVTCTFTNTVIPASAQVIKTVNGGAPLSTDPPFVFELRIGADATTSRGQLLSTGTATTANGGIVNFTNLLIPGQTYQLCELAILDWTTNMVNSFALYNPGGVNPAQTCINFIAGAPGSTTSIPIDNQRPPTPGGQANTIGYWKNWASCSGSNGKQAPILDQTLAKAPAGVTIGDLYLSPTDCLKAVAILNKSDIVTGRKLASDPVFNLASQYLAYLLNVKFGTTPCPDLQNAAQTFLAWADFNGTATHKKLNSAQAAYANQLAGLLDTYNNNGFGGAACPASIPVAPALP